MMIRVFADDGEATAALIIVLDNQGLRESIPECTPCQAPQRRQVMWPLYY